MRRVGQKGDVTRRTSGCSAYDGEFVALAMELDISLVSTNPAVLKKFPAIAVSLESFTSG